MGPRQEAPSQLLTLELENKAGALILGRGQADLKVSPRLRAPYILYPVGSSDARGR